MTDSIDNRYYIQINYKQFNEKYAELKNTNLPFAVLFVGGNAPGTNESWCGDTIRAHSVITSTVIPICEKKKIPLLEIEVGSKEEWKYTDHPIRNHPDLMITNVPTLILNIHGRFTKKLVEGQVMSDVLLSDFFLLDG